MQERGSRPAVRAHIGLEVQDVARSTDFYRSFLGREPSKARPGYARFELAEPALNLSLIENPARRSDAHRAGALHHGIEVASPADVGLWLEHLLEAGLLARPELGTVCCYARQDKVWVTDPDGNAWEVFTVREDADRGWSSEGCCPDARAAV